jgi:hypothetical protein
MYQKMPEKMTLTMHMDAQRAFINAWENANWDQKMIREISDSVKIMCI